MVLIPLLIIAVVFITMFGLYFLLTGFRPPVRQVPPPASSSAEDPKDVLREIPVVCHSRDEGVRDCSVCLSSVEEGEKVRILPDCGHGFHAGCIDEWLTKQLSCPFCRSPVKSPAKSSETNHEAVESLTGLRRLASSKMAFWRNREGQSSSRVDDGSNGGGESDHEREESSPV